MPRYELRIVVETVKKGSGVEAAKAEVDALGQKLKAYGTQADAASVRSAALAAKQPWFGTSIFKKEGLPAIAGRPLNHLH